MSTDTLAHEVPATVGRSTAARDDRQLAPGRAARELGLKRSEFDVAVGLGRIVTVPDEGGGGRSVTWAEIDRVRGREGFPEALRESVRTVGTTEGAALMKVPRTRFTRLARLGLLVPVKGYVNRYRAVVWLYLADELRQFVSDESNTGLLRGPAPERSRQQLRDGLDRRPRNWRGRHLGFLLRQTDDPWGRAAAVASLLDPDEITTVVQDPYERAQLDRLRPAPVIRSTPESPAAELVEEIMTAADPDEIHWLRTELSRLLDTAREHHVAPCPSPNPHPAARPSGHPAAHRPPDRTCHQAVHHPPGAAERPRGLLGRLRRRNTRCSRRTSSAGGRPHAG